jgi:GNAT superfamily N-acetyltransferase
LRARGLWKRRSESAKLELCQPTLVNCQSGRALRAALAAWCEMSNRGSLFTIERAAVEDVDLVKQVLSETWVDTYAGHLSRSTIEQVTTRWHAPSVLRSQIEKPGDYFAVAKHAGTIIGLITVVALNRDELHLSRLYVRPAYQGKGVGTRLLDAAIACYPDATLLRLEVEQHNAKGHAYWRSRMFVDIGAKMEQIGTDELAVITMERVLK